MRGVTNHWIRGARKPESRVITRNSGPSERQRIFSGIEFRASRNMFCQFAGFLIAEFGVRRDGVPDQFKAVDVGRADRRW